MQAISWYQVYSAQAIHTVKTTVFQRIVKHFTNMQIYAFQGHHREII